MQMAKGPCKVRLFETIAKIIFPGKTIFKMFLFFNFSFPNFYVCKVQSDRFNTNKTVFMVVLNNLRYFYISKTFNLYFI